MEQRSGHSTLVEMEVAAILLELPHLFEAKHNKVPLLPPWGASRKRSLQSPPPTVVQEIQCKKLRVKGEASSPATPLAFCPSESDDKSKLFKRKLSVKKTKEELLEIINEQTQSNKLLTKKVEHAKQYYQQMKETNLWLLTRKQELRLADIRSEKPKTEVKASSILTPEVKQVISAVSVDQVVIDQRALIIERMGNKVETSESYPNYYPYGKNMSLFQSKDGLGLGMKIEMVKNNVGPSGGVPDLNVSSGAGESFWMMELAQHTVDDMNKSFNKALAAQARKRRMLICRDKNTNSGTSLKLRLSHR